jgi:hypothetical protein
MVQNKEYIMSIIAEERNKYKEWQKETTERKHKIRMLMYKDYLIDILLAIYSFSIPAVIIYYLGFSFLTGLISGIFLSIIVFITYQAIKEDNRTRASRV